MRELVVEDQKVLIIPQNFKFASTGKVVSVSAGEFNLELDYEPEGLLENTYCEFFTQTQHGKLYFDSYAKKIDGRILTIASTAKHKFLQRRQYTRVKYINKIKITSDDSSYDVSTLDISAGGLKFTTPSSVNIEHIYAVNIPLSENLSISCKFQPIRIERNNDEGFTVSGQFIYDSNHDRMQIVQYCAKRNVEIKNK